MMTKDNILKAIEEFFGDTRRSPEETLADLEEIREKVQENIDLLEDDLKTFG